VIDPRKTNFVEQLRALVDRGLDAEACRREFLRLQRAVAESKLRVPIAGYAEGLSVECPKFSLSSLLKQFPCLLLM
jgi:hypothetical protein